MPQANIFQWRAGIGWLVVTGGGAPDSEDNLSIIAAALSRTVSQGPLAYVWAASDIESADRHMDLLRDLGARTGYLVDVLTEEDDELYRQLDEAGIIILGDGPRQETMRDALVGAAMRGIEESFTRGATLYAVGASAALIGAYAAEGETLVPGFGWLANSIILPGYTSDQADQLRSAVQHVEDGYGYGLGLGAGAALAFGPRGEVEVWGNKAITVSLGQRYS
jgi:hypothetical protein